MASDGSRDRHRAPDSTDTHAQPDTRSPLLRFRTAPMKARSVTDLVSPSWCELQYWYTLTKHGRKRRTPAMRQGSAVHQRLEDEVHTKVPVDVTTKEDAWGLRLWNVIQGLRTLTETGQTRELEVWGMVDGLFVNGVIDELSWTCPDPALQMEEDVKHGRTGNPADQTTLDDFLKTAGEQSSAPRRIYITDVKTRGSKTMPKGASFRPTFLQLMLYHRLLSDLACNRVAGEDLFQRYGLRGQATFSDSFISQIGSLQEEGERDSLEVLTAHNSLAQLWTLMMQQMQQTFRAGAHSISTVLQAEYRRAEDGRIVGSRSCVYDGDALKRYLAEEMRWGRGEGVPVEEAFKCRSCDFADSCSWRISKIQEATVSHRLKRTNTDF